jgi:phosphoribosylaminoimidazole carboxylase (NCAIR synthetase)
MPGERPLWYGKSHSSEGRKMGHLVVTGRDAQEIDEALRKFEQWEASFWSKI